MIALKALNNDLLVSKEGGDILRLHDAVICMVTSKKRRKEGGMCVCVCVHMCACMHVLACVCLCACMWCV